MAPGGKPLGTGTRHVTAVALINDGTQDPGYNRPRGWDRARRPRKGHQAPYNVLVSKYSFTILHHSVLCLITTLCRMMVYSTTISRPTEVASCRSQYSSIPTEHASVLDPVPCYRCPSRTPRSRRVPQ